MILLFSLTCSLTGNIKNHSVEKIELESNRYSCFNISRVFSDRIFEKLRVQYLNMTSNINISLISRFPPFTWSKWLNTTISIQYHYSTIPSYIICPCHKSTAEFLSETLVSQSLHLYDSFLLPNMHKFWWPIIYMYPKYSVAMVSPQF
jgi:hypothetical protein